MFHTLTEPGIFYTFPPNQREARMSKSPFSLNEVRGICIEPYLQAARDQDAARQADARAEARRSGGVAWSGLGAGPSQPPRSAAEIRADAEAALARAEAFAASPRGRFLLGVRALDQLGYAAHAEKARAAFARGFADPDRPACPAEIGVALGALARIDQPPARTACLALAELLSGSLGLAAE
jgi:hypothetical protein